MEAAQAELEDGRDRRDLLSDGGPVVDDLLGSRRKQGQRNLQSPEARKER